MSAKRYQLIRLLNRGGMGLLYEGWDRTLGRRVAVKVLLGGMDPFAHQRAVQEAQAAARVCSDHVVQIYDASPAETKDRPYLVMELLRGEDLQAIIGNGPVVAEQAVDWILQACEAVAHLTVHGIVHRDIKPANLFLEQRLDGTQRLKLIDFGVAKHSIVPNGVALTSAGQVIGSLPYLAPEQLSDAREVDVRTDVWGLGVVLYELLSGQSPFETPQLFDSVARIKSQEHESLTSINKGTPAGLSQIVDQCLEKSKDRRWGDMAELARALAPYATHRGATVALQVQRIGALPPPLPAAPCNGPGAPIELEVFVKASDADLPSLIANDPHENARKPSSYVSVSASAAMWRSDANWGSRFVGQYLRRKTIAGAAAMTAAVLALGVWRQSQPTINYQIIRPESSQLPCDAPFAVYEARNMIKSTGATRGRDWNLFTNGSVSQSHTFEKGRVELIITASGDFAGDDLPHLIVSVDNQIVGEADVQSKDFQSYQFSFEARTGIALVRIEFSNDFLENGNDRNLLLRDLKIGQCGVLLRGQ